VPGPGRRAAPSTPVEDRNLDDWGNGAIDALAAADGTLLNGVIMLTPSVPKYVAGWAVAAGSAS
jgi:hypothetical protein